MVGARLRRFRGDVGGSTAASVVGSILMESSAAMMANVSVTCVRVSIREQRVETSEGGAVVEG